MEWGFDVVEDRDEREVPFELKARGSMGKVDRKKRKKWMKESR